MTGLRAWLLAERVTHVAMEATSSYWLPVWRVLEEGGPFKLLLCNARHVRHVPGRKTDVKDASWLCQLCEVGWLQGSFVPPPEIRRLRQVTRYRKRLVQLRTGEVQRVEKTLEDAVVKIGAVASSTLTKSGRAMIEALIRGERDPQVLAELAMARLRPKIHGPSFTCQLRGADGCHRCSAAARESLFCVPCGGARARVMT